MGLDLRLPLGLMFLIIGTVMLGYGFVTWHSPMYASSLGENVNVIWGGVMVAFGGIMFFLGMRGRRADRINPAAHGSQPPVSRRTGH